MHIKATPYPRIPKHKKSPDLNHFDLSDIHAILKENMYSWAINRQPTIARFEVIFHRGE